MVPWPVACLIVAAALLAGWYWGDRRHSRLGCPVAADVHELDRAGLPVLPGECVQCCLDPECQQHLWRVTRPPCCSGAGRVVPQRKE